MSSRENGFSSLILNASAALYGLSPLDLLESNGPVLKESGVGRSILEDLPSPTLNVFGLEKRVEIPEPCESLRCGESRVRGHSGVPATACSVTLLTPWPGGKRGDPQSRYAMGICALLQEPLIINILLLEDLYGARCFIYIISFNFPGIITIPIIEMRKLSLKKVTHLES